MADPFSIIGVIGVAAQLIQMSVEFGLDWKDAPEDTKSFIVELQSLKTILSETNTNILINPEFKKAFDGKHSAMLSQLGATAQSETKKMLLDCRTELESVLQGLTKSAQGHRMGWERIKSAFKSTRMRETVEKLNRQCQTLNQLMAVDILKLGVNILNEVKEGRALQEKWQQDDAKAHASIQDGVNKLQIHTISKEAERHRKSFFEWLKAPDYSAQQNEFFSRREAGTGQWLLDSKEYTEWVASVEKSKQTLFCPGIPGAGKTILTSVVVDDLRTRFSDNKTVSLAYIYFDFRTRDTYKIDDIFASLLEQFLSPYSLSSNLISSFVEEKKVTETPRTQLGVSNLLRAAMSVCSELYVVIDALDECQTSNNCLSTFLTELFKLQKEAKVKVFGTSRFVPEVTDRFKDSSSLEISAKPQDIKAYLQGQMAALPNFVQRNFQLQEHIKAVISQATDGM